MEFLNCSHQNYQWGKIGPQSIVYDLVASQNQELNLDCHYAELWMGTHSSGPSFIKKNNQKLHDYLKENPEVLGKIPQFYNLKDNLPFLFKVLSVETALSIQAHPDLQLAKSLNLNQPEIYKDPNHKPEMAIALTSFEVLSNFCPKDQILDNLKSTDLFYGFYSQTEIDQLKNSKDIDDGKSVLKQLIHKLIKMTDLKVVKIFERVDGFKIIRTVQI